MFNTIQKELNQLIDLGLDRTLRIAVTGLSRSGKTAFITSLINQLLHINRVNNPHLPLFEAARNCSIVAVKRIPQQDLRVPRFDYEANLNDLMRSPPVFPQSTRGVSETRLALRYQRNQGVLSYIKERSTLYLDIFDYPGEWLLDLPLLDLSYQQWSLQLQGFFSGIRAELGRVWLEKLKKIDLSAAANEDILAQLAKDYTAYLLDCKAKGLHFIQPGRFVLPGELEGAPVLQFCPLVHLTEEQWQKLKHNAASNSYFSVLNQRYEYYRQHIVKRFYQDYFARFDRQVILADCLTALNHSRQAFSASKADHITAEQIPNLVSLLRQLVQEGGRYVEFEGIETDYTAIAAIRATQQVAVNQNGKIFKALQGVRSSDKQKITVYPGSVPNKLPSEEFWSKQKFDFDQFEPQPLEPGESIPHLRMDSVLQFLLGDKLE